MKNWASYCLLIFAIVSCKDPDLKLEPSLGIWQAELSVLDSQVLPFNFKLARTESGTYQMEIYNAEEVITVDEISIWGDSIKIQTPVFEGFIEGTFSNTEINGRFVKESLDRIVPFKASFGVKDRFNDAMPTTLNVSGIWETEFSQGAKSSYMAEGIFEQQGNKVNGTFRTTTGDYRYLEGVLSGDSLRVSAFDGAHAFLFTAKVTDSSMNGMFYSGNHFKEPFVSKRNEAYELPHADSLTFLKDGYDRLTFSFPDVEGNMVSLEDDRFKNKVILVQLMGTWCPNCLDETKYYVDYLKNNKDTDLEILALAFESAKTEEVALKSISRLRDRIGIPYPILLAQFGSYDKELAQQKLPMLNHVLSYPTTIFIDKKGNVRKIHTGFNGPATGEKFIEFQIDFDAFVKTLLAEE